MFDLVHITSLAPEFGMRHRTARRNRIGFTLVELLVVIAVIGLLIAMLMPSLQRARASARNVQCMSNLRQIAIAANVYVNENSGWALSKTQGSADNGRIVVAAVGGHAEGAPGGRWLDDIYMLLGKNLSVLECPEQKTERPTIMYLWFLHPTAMSPFQATRPPYYPGYMQTATLWTYRPSSIGIRPLKFREMRNPASKIWYADAGMYYAADLKFYETWRAKSSRGMQDATINSQSATVSARHSKRGNVVFFDGHVESVDPYEVMPLKSMFNAPSVAERKIWATYWDPDGDGNINTP